MKTLVRTKKVLFGTQVSMWDNIKNFMDILCNFFNPNLSFGTQNDHLKFKMCKKDLKNNTNCVASIIMTSIIFFSWTEEKRHILSTWNIRKMSKCFFEIFYDYDEHKKIVEIFFSYFSFQMTNFADENERMYVFML